MPKSAAPQSAVPQSPAQAARSQLRLARILLAVQVPTSVLAGALLFWNLGLSRHSHHRTAFAGVVTGGYAVLSIAVIAWMQWSMRSRARRLAREGAASSSAGA